MGPHLSLEHEEVQHWKQVIGQMYVEGEAATSAS